MRVRGRRALAVVLSAVGSVWGASGAQAALPPERLEALDAYLVDIQRELGVPGMAVVIADDGQVVRQTVLGVADDDGRRLTPQTPMMLASTSKAFTALAVMQLVEAGTIDLDAPVQAYLPWFRVADEAASAAITIRQLLNHTSGLSTGTGQRTHDPDDQDDGALERGVRSLAVAELVGAPGDRFEYSNANYDTLGLVVQAVSGMPFSRYLEANVFGPLGMTHSHGTVAAARADGLSAGFYPWWGTDWRPINVALPRTGGPSATMFVSPEDMGHALIAHLDGGPDDGRPVLSAEGVASMQAPAVIVDDFHAYGMGWYIRPYWEMLDVTDPDSVGYALPALVEHEGAWANARTYVGLVPSLGWGVAVLVNGNDETRPEALSAVFSSALSILAGKEAVGVAAPTDLLAGNARQLAIGLLILELGSLAWSVWWLARRARRPMPAWRRLTALVVPLALDVLVVWLTLSYVPDSYATSLTRIMESLPDIGMVASVAVGIALVWGIVRTVLMVLVAGRARAVRRGAEA